MRVNARENNIARSCSVGHAGRYRSRVVFGGLAEHTEVCRVPALRRYTEHAGIVRSGIKAIYAERYRRIFSREKPSAVKFGACPLRTVYPCNVGAFPFFFCFSAF